MGKVLEVKNLKINFRTGGGKVQAVRDIDFDLFKGETLAIVGESGSGKSVTSRAIMGILAGNAIVAGGKILYDGQDLLKISEDDFHKIRGDRIAMIFQDPMSSLNPIMKVGKQLTEAMILKGRSSQKRARAEFNSRLELLRQNMTDALPEDADRETLSARYAQLTQTFDKFCIVGTKLEADYNDSLERVTASLTLIEDLLFYNQKNHKTDYREKLRAAAVSLGGKYNGYLINTEDGQLTKLSEELKAACSRLDKKSTGLDEETVRLLSNTRDILASALCKIRPNFFTLGYYIYRNPEAQTDCTDIEGINEMTRDYLDREFMLNFLVEIKKGLKYSHEKALEGKKEAIKYLSNKILQLQRDGITETECDNMVKDMSRKVYLSIDRLAVAKDSAAYTFTASIKSAVRAYFSAEKGNPIEQKRYDQQLKKYQELINKGKTPDWEITPLALADLTELKKGISDTVTGLISVYEGYLADEAEFDTDAAAVAFVDDMKEKASAVVYRVTRSIARYRALKLLEEVGISETRIRYNQYPFEFSGGMRQRIVIAIALAANPDILICDEPTTALDVTIQAQILELINQLKTGRKLSVIFITHDLGVVANMADRIAVMYAGKIVEYGTSEDIFYNPKHPYTWALLSSMPDLETREKLDSIPGAPPNMIFPPKGDAFAERNKYALNIDFEMQPPMFKVSDTHYAATWLLHPDAPSVEPPKAIQNRIKKRAERRQNNV